MKKIKDLSIITIIYFFSYIISFYVFKYIDNTLLSYFIFDTVATVIIFVFSTLFRNSSVYDPYWSLTPMVMVLKLFIDTKSFSVFNSIFLIAFCIWAIRLTVNWCVVFTDFSYEDWRYKKFRDESNKYLWPIINFFGIHYMPTLFVFMGMLPIFEIVKHNLSVVSLVGSGIMLIGTILELLADRTMHKFLKNSHKSDVCEEGLWNYSRHPNYLGEITFWVGVAVTVLTININYWYCGIGALAIAIMFNVVSIPLMEKRQLNRREGYKKYCVETSRLLILPKKIK